MMFNVVKFDPTAGIVVPVPIFMTIADQGPNHIVLEGRPPDSETDYRQTLDTNRFVRIRLEIDPANGRVNRLCTVYKRGVFINTLTPPNQYLNNRKHATGGKRITKTILEWLAEGMVRR